MTLTELSRRTGLNVTTLRHYEKIGVFSRSAGDRREGAYYDREAERRLHFIAHARKVGFDLAFSRLMLDVISGRDIAAEEHDATVKLILQEVHERIEVLGTFESFLTVATSGGNSRQVDPLTGIENLVDQGATSTPHNFEHVGRRTWRAMRRRRFAIR